MTNARPYITIIVPTFLHRTVIIFNSFYVHFVSYSTTKANGFSLAYSLMFYNEHLPIIITLALGMYDDDLSLVVRTY